jgi:hypothetical protein
VHKCSKAKENRISLVNRILGEEENLNNKKDTL